MKSVGSIRFATFVILFIAGADFLIADSYFPGVMFVSSSGLLLTTKADWRRQYPARDTAVIIAPLVLFPIVFLWVPTKAIEHYATHPIFVIVPSITVLLVTLNRWRKDRSETTPSDP